MFIRFGACVKAPALTRIKSPMTTPYERTRALLATRAFLQDLLYGQASELPAKALREEARTLLRHFVLPADLMLAHYLAPDWFASPDDVKLPPK